jgi:hypothetical protein
MALPPLLLNAIRKGSTDLEIVADLALDSGTVTYSQSRAHGIPVLASVPTLHHKLQAEFGKTSVARIEIELIDRPQWRDMVAHEYIKNRRATLKVGLRGGEAASFWSFFTGLIVDFTIKNDVLTLEIEDDLYVTQAKIPEENDTKTQTLAFQNQNPIDIKTALLETYGGVPAARIDSTTFTTEKEKWFQGWTFDRVLTSPVEIKTLLNELDGQTLNTLFTDGDKITCATFAPPIPGMKTGLLQIEDGWLRGSLEVSGAMTELMCNKCVVLYDYDESGSDGEEHYDSVVIVADAASQGASEWDEVVEKIIESKWIRSYTVAQPTAVTGVSIYCINRHNGPGTGLLSYNVTNKTLSWTAPGDSSGTVTKVDKDGKYQLFSGTATKWIRVVVTYASLPGSNQNENLAVTDISGSLFATALATHWVARYRDPQAELTFDLDFGNAIYLNRFLKVSDVIKISSERIITKGKPEWSDELIFLTSARPDFQKKRMRMTGMQTTFAKRYGFIAPSTVTADYDGATDDEREYAFIADASNYLGTNNDPAYHIW